MDENNVFNSFSFKKWAKYVREQRMEEEIRRQRMEQVIRLRNKLIRERAIRDQVDLLTDDDVDKLVHYMNTAGKSFAGIATGIQSTVRFGRRPSMGPMAATSKVPIPSISATIHPSAGQSGISTQIAAGTSKQHIEKQEEDEDEEQRPLELSEKVPLEEARNANYIFGEIPILAPLHLHRSEERSNQQKKGFLHNIRHGTTPKSNKSFGPNLGQFTAVTRPMESKFQQQQNRTKKKY